MRTLLALLALLTACSLESSALRPATDGSTMDAPGPDSGMADTIVPPDGCVPRAESCNAIDDDCDGTTDEGFDTSRDPVNCGACGTVCNADPPNAATACVDGRCDPRCDVGFANCNADPADGCEADLNEPATCGSCTTACSGGMPLCQAGSCVASCGGGTMLCGGTSCVDLDTDARHCGACGNACPARDHAVPTCSDGTCSFTCDADFDDCDSAPTNGCEASLMAPGTCGTCGTDCALPNAIPSCDMGACDFVCQAGFGNCDADDSNGCEDTLRSLTNCGACGVACAPPGATGDCSTGSCVAAGCTEPFRDCDGDPTNGCERNTAFDESSCGRCGGSACAGVCNGTQCYTDCLGASCTDCAAGATCMCDSGTCGHVCAGATCDARCQGSGIRCIVLGNDSAAISRCTGGADCISDYRYSSNAVTGRCENSGTTCSVDCRGATGTCRADCRSGAECELLCDGAADCDFSRCDGMMTDCGGGRLVCNSSGSC